MSGMVDAVSAVLPGADAFTSSLTAANLSLPQASSCPFGLEKEPLAENMALIIGLCVVSGVTFFGNVLIILAIIMEPRLNTISNQYYISLASADAIVGFLSMPAMLIATVHGCWPLGLRVCDFWTFIDSMACIASFLSLCFIGHDRYCAVSDPFKHMRTQSKRRVRVRILIIWVVASVSCTPAIILTRQRNGTLDSTGCEFTPGLVIALAISLFIFYIPISFMLTYYIRLYSIIRRTLRSSVAVGGGAKKMALEVGTEISTGNDTSISVLDSSDNGSVTKPAETKGEKATKKRESDEQRSRMKKEQRAARTLGLIIVVFISCWTLWMISWPLKNMFPNLLPEWMLEFACWLACGNSALNPFLYVFSNRDFRIGCMRVLRRLFLCQRH